MLVVLAARVRTVVGRVLNSARTALRDAFQPAPMAAGLVHDVLRSRKELLAENALLRQQLIVAGAKGEASRAASARPRIMVALARLLPNWTGAVLLVKPETVLRWHREGFRLFWKRRSKPAKLHEPRIDANTISLIHRMARENRLWGAERIRGELLKLGIRVSKRTVQRYIRGARPPAPPRGQSWHSFLRNHTVWACDFLQTYDVCFRPIFAFFIVDVNTKRVVHVGVTRAPTQAWTAQQLRNATPLGNGPQFIIRDRDDKFSAEFDRVAKGAGARVIRSAVRAPLMNSICERFLGSIRRECLDHIVIFNERHMRSVLEEYCFAYFNHARPHQGLAQRVPLPISDESSRGRRTITAAPVLGGLHYDYRWAA